MIYFIRKKELHKKIMISMLSFLLLGSVIITIQLVPQSYARAEQKTKLNWYFEDLRSQGFDIYYNPVAFSAPIDPNTNSYLEFIQKAKEINATTIGFHGGGQSYFIFFLNTGITITANAEGYCLCNFNLNNPLPN